MSEKVTVVITAHDRPEWLSGSLDSVLRQTYSNVEIIVVGSASTGSSFGDLSDQYEDKVTYCEIEDTGVGPMMNEALQIATGDFIARLDEGDVFLPGKTELQLEVFRKDPDTGLVITACQVADRDSGVQRTLYVPDPIQNTLLLFLICGYMFDGSRTMVRRECYDRVGPYKDSSAAENDMWIRLARHYKVGVINDPLVRQRVHPVDKPLEEQIRRDIQQTVSESLSSIPLQEIFPYLRSHPEESLVASSAHAAKGVLLMQHKLYDDARDSFVEAHQLCPEASIPHVWMGLRSLQLRDYQTAVDCLAKVPQDDKFYLDAQWVTTLTREVQKTSPNIRSKLRSELTKECDIMLQTTLDFANGRVDGLTSLLSDMVEEVQLYLDWDISQVMSALSGGWKLMRDEWNSKILQTPDDIIDFYKQTENYIFDLAWWHRDPERRRMTAVAMEICRRNGSQKILDFGCGIGQDGILFAEDGFHVTLADLPGKTFDYARWRAERRALAIKCINSDELSEEYDAILCFDVLEHIWEPRETVEYLRHHLSDKGILLVTTHFEHTDVHPMHLERNAKYIGEGFIKMMSEAGFILEPSSIRWPLVFRVRRDAFRN